MRLFRAVESLRAMAADAGWLAPALYVLDRLLQVLGRGRARVVPYVLVAQPLQAQAPALRSDATTTLGLVERSDAIVQHFPRPLPVLHRRWDAGASCHVARVRDVFAGHIWLQRDGYDEDEVRCRFVLPGPHAVWDYDVYVEPRFRLGRTMARLWAHVATACAAEGVCWSFSRISMFNAASLKSHARLGARPVGRAVFVVIGPWQLMLSSLAPRWHLSRDERRVPALRLPSPGDTVSAPAR